jgi:hypothetical protein
MTPHSVWIAKLPFGIVCQWLDGQVSTEEPTVADNLATRRTI